MRLNLKVILFIIEFVLVTNSSLFSIRIANELSEFRNYLFILYTHTGKYQEENKKNLKNYSFQGLTYIKVKISSQLVVRRMKK